MYEYVEGYRPYLIPKLGQVTKRFHEVVHVQS